MKPGDHVLIIKGPPDKQGLVDVITFLMGNGAMVRLDKDWYSPIQFNHLEQLYRCSKCNNLKHKYEMSKQDICMKCEKEALVC